MAKLTKGEKERYHRQMIVSGWGEEGQQRLKDATIGVVGAGGLGSPLLIYLAAAGFGRIVLADGDTVELSNLNRQVLHWQEDIGSSKVDSAGGKLRRMNPDVEIVTFAGQVDESNIDELFAGADALMDCLDNFPSRYLLNDYAVKRRIPFFHAAVWGLEGRVTTIIPGQTACFRCIYPVAPPPELFPVVGVAPGLVAVIQVTEAIKFFVGIGDLLTGRLLVYDGGSMSFMPLKTRRDPDCPACSIL